MKTFYIRADYKLNTPNQTNDNVSGNVYWDEERMRQSETEYQFYVYKRAHAYARSMRYKYIVDIGCGSAKKLNSFFSVRFKTFGIDQQAAINYCKSVYKTGVFLVEDFDNPTLRIKELIPRADLVICSNIIEHVEDPDTLLDYIKAVSGPETVIFLATPERESLCGENVLTPKNPFHVREWSKTEFNEYVSRRHFEVMEHHVLFPFRFRLNLDTLGYLRGRRKQRLPFNNNQLIICKIKLD